MCIYSLVGAWKFILSRLLYRPSIGVANFPKNQLGVIVEEQMSAAYHPTRKQLRFFNCFLSDFLTKYLFGLRILRYFHSIPSFVGIYCESLISEFLLLFFCLTFLLLILLVNKAFLVIIILIKKPVSFRAQHDFRREHSPLCNP